MIGLNPVLGETIPLTDNVGKTARCTFPPAMPADEMPRQIEREREKNGCEAFNLIPSTRAYPMLSYCFCLFLLFKPFLISLSFLCRSLFRSFVRAYASRIPLARYLALLSCLSLVASGFGFGIRFNLGSGQLVLARLASGFRL